MVRISASRFSGSFLKLDYNFVPREANVCRATTLTSLNQVVTSSKTLLVGGQQSQEHTISFRIHTIIGISSVVLLTL